MITILLQKILEQVKTLKTNIENLPTGLDRYSTIQHIVGTWIDGSTLYEKTIDCGALLNNDIKSIPMNISNLGVVYETKIQMVNSSGVSTSIPYNSTSGSDTVYAFITGDDIRIGTRSDRTDYTAYATIRYTLSST